MSRRESGIASFVRVSGSENFRSSGSEGSIQVPGLSDADISEIVNSSDRIGPEEIFRIQDQEIHRSIGAEMCNFGGCK